MGGSVSPGSTDEIEAERRANRSLGRVAERFGAAAAAAAAAS